MTSVDSPSLPFFLDVAVGGRPNCMHISKFFATEEPDVEHESAEDLSRSSEDDYLHDNEKEKGQVNFNGKDENATKKQGGGWSMEIMEDGTITYTTAPSISSAEIEPKVEGCIADIPSTIPGRLSGNKESANGTDQKTLTSLYSSNAIEKGVCSHYERPGSFGQDAYAVYAVPRSPVQCIAVADGVGGWRDNGIDSGILSRALMRECVKKAPQFGKTADGPLELMKTIYETVKISGEVDAGSTTACILTLSGVPPPVESQSGDITADQMLIDDFLASQLSTTETTSTASSTDTSKNVSNSSSPEVSQNGNSESSPPSPQNIRILSAEQSANSPSGQSTTEKTTSKSAVPSQKPSSHSANSKSSILYLHCANLGDSGYFLLRNSRVVSRSGFQRDGRIVKQLAVIPPRYVGHSYCDDPPEDSSLTHCEVQDGDILIVASDGLWDNLIPPPPLFFHYIFGLMSHDGSLVNWNEQLKEKIESLVEECQWEADRDQKDYYLGSSEMINENPFVGSPSSKLQSDIDDTTEKKSKRNSALVRKLCDRLVHDASAFMNTMHGKPDDLTVLVAQICRC